MQGAADVAWNSANGLILVGNNSLTIAGTISNQGSGDLTLDGGAIAINNTVDMTTGGGTGAVNIVRTTNNTQIDVGAANGGNVNITNADLTNITATNVVIGDGQTDDIRVEGVTTAATANIDNLSLDALENNSSITFQDASSAFNAATAVNLSAENGITIADDDVVVTINDVLTADANNNDSNDGAFTIQGGGGAAAELIVNQDSTIESHTFAIAGAGIDAGANMLTIVNDQNDGIGLGGTAVGGFQIDDAELGLTTAGTLRLDASGGGDVTVNGITALSSDAIDSIDIISSGIVTFATGASVFDTAAAVATDALAVTADTISITAGVNVNNGDLSLATSGASPGITIGAAVAAGANAVNIDGTAAGTKIDVGIVDPGTPGDIVITNADLTNITATNVNIGGLNTDDIAVNGVTDAATTNITNLDLVAAGSVIDFENNPSVINQNLSATGDVITFAVAVTSTTGNIIATSTDSGGGGDIAVNAMVSAAAGDVALLADDSVTVAGGSVVADGLAIQSDTDPGLSPTVSRLAANITAGGFIFVNAAALDITTVQGLMGVSATDVIDITATGSLTVSQLVSSGGGAADHVSLTTNASGGADTIILNAAVNAAGADLRLNSAEDITQTVEVTADNLQALSDTGVTLTDVDNNVGTIAGTATSSGNFSYVDADALIVGTVNGTMGLTGAAAINLSTVGGSLTINDDVTAGGGATDHVTLATGTTGGSDTIALDAAVDATGADLRISSGDNITQSVEVTAANLQALSDTGVALADVDNSVGTIAGMAVSSGDFTYVDSDMLIVGTVNGTMGVTGAAAINLSTVGGSLTVSQGVTAGGGATDHVTLATGTTGGSDTIALNAAVDATGADLRLSSGDNITQSVEVTAANLQALSDTGVAMADAQNAVGTIAGTAVSSGDFTYVDSDMLIVGTVNGTMGVVGADAINISTVGGSLTVSNVVTAGGGATDHVTLATGTTGGSDTIALNAAVSAPICG